MAKKLKTYEVLVKALDNFSLVGLDINVLNKKGKNVFKKIKESAASGWPITYLSFIEENGESFTIKTGNSAKNWNGALEYSTDTQNWSEWNGTEISSSNDGKLYLRGTGNSTITNWQKFVLTDNKRIQCLGNIETLLDYQAVRTEKHPTMANGCFANMFFNCTSLTTAPELPATTLAESCYSSMFKCCTSLTAAPELPATTLAKKCYEEMFYVCTSITKAPELPATVLAQACYHDMFNSCSSLTSAPKLPTTTLAGSCYQGMFYRCESLTKAPELPATTLADECYKYMFEGCKSLTKAPELPAATLTKKCYEEMFRDCVSLTAAPSQLPATELAEDCYYRMFYNDNALTGTIHCPQSTSANKYRLNSNTDNLPKYTATVVYDL